MQSISITRLVFHLEAPGKVSKEHNYQKWNSFLISQFEISGKALKEQQLINIKLISMRFSGKVCNYSQRSAVLDHST